MIHQPPGANDAYAQASPGYVFAIENLGKVRDPRA